MNLPPESHAGASQDLFLTQGEERLEDVSRLRGMFPDLPVEALVKEDLLRLGISFSAEALKYCADYKRKSYFIFSFDMVPIDEMAQDENLSAPEEIQLIGGGWNLRRTTVSVRVNPYSPWRADMEGDQLVLTCGDQSISQIDLQPVPEYYQETLENGQPVHEVAPTIEWGYLVYLEMVYLGLSGQSGIALSGLSGNSTSIKAA